ncbi:MAG: cupredoxin domain-containing protein [Rhizobiales bacterium]|nr:cupredoxin domain-containing protein [Hyphomicrobiales bacterium]
MERPLLKTLSLSGVVVALVFTATAALADDTLSIKIENHKFTPTELHVPANKRVSVYVENADATPEEFESTTLKVEKVIPGKSKALVRMGPLAPGRYDFIGEFHMDTAKGTVVAE